MNWINYTDLLYRVLLIQLLRVLFPLQRIRKKKKIVKSHSLTSKLVLKKKKSKLSTIKNHDM